MGHTREVCYSLHGKLKNAHVTQTEYTGNPTNQLFILSEAEYNEFLRYQASKQTSSIASVAQVGYPVNPVACISQSTTLGLGLWTQVLLTTFLVTNLYCLMLLILSPFPLLH